MERFQELAAFFAAALSGMFGLLAQQISYVAFPLPESPAHTEIIFVGDMMFDRSIRTTMDSYGPDFVFSCIAPELASADFAVGNLEGPITGEPSKSVGSIVGSHNNFVFTFPLYVASLLQRNNMRAVSIGNNHILNFEEAGVETTMKELEKAHVGHFGSPTTHSVYEIDSRKVPLSFIAYNQFDAGWSASTTINQIRDARAKNRIAIVYAHWGDEYVAANDLQKNLAHRFIDAGAEMVIGAHPHVIQERETYRGKYIYYSLGNFIFDQYWMDAVKNGLMVHVTISTKGVTAVRESHVVLEKDRRTCPLRPQK